MLFKFNYPVVECVLVLVTAVWQQKPTPLFCSTLKLSMYVVSTLSHFQKPNTLSLVCTMQNPRESIQIPGILYIFCGPKKKTKNFGVLFNFSCALLTVFHVFCFCWFPRDVVVDDDDEEMNVVFFCRILPDFIDRFLIHWIFGMLCCWFSFLGFCCCFPHPSFNFLQRN